MPVFTCEFLASIGQAPNLEELNLSAQREEAYRPKNVYRGSLDCLQKPQEFTFDMYMCRIIASLRRLSIFRFTDDFPKPCEDIIAVMVDRARKQTSPVVLRLPFRENKDQVAKWQKRNKVNLLGVRGIYIC